MPKRQEKKHRGYYRRQIKGPDGRFHDVYGKTMEERDRKVEAQQALWAAEEQPGEQLYTVDYLRGWYARRSPGMKKDAQANARRHINNVIAPVIGDKLLADVTSDDLRQIMANVAGMSQSYQKKLVGTIKGIFSDAAEAGKISRDPSLKIKAGGEEPEQKEALTEEEQQILLEAVQGLPVELFVQIGLYTGMRREEILGLKWDSVELGGAAPRVTVRRALRWPDNHRPEISRELKTPAASRTIPIPPQLVAALQGARAGEKGSAAEISRRTVIHGKDGEPLTYSAFRSQWHAVTVRSVAGGRKLGDKIKNHKVAVSIPRAVSPHLLRHTYITRLILGGVDLKRVQYLAGHDDPEITLKIYTSLMQHRPEDLIASVQAVFAPKK